MLPAARESMEHQQCISERAPAETYHQPAVLKAPSHMLIPGNAAFHVCTEKRGNLNTGKPENR